MVRLNNTNTDTPMGLIDRDYMNGKSRQRPFSPPPERQGAGFLKIALIFALVFYALFHLSQWALDQRAPAPRHWALKPLPASELKSPAPQAPASPALPPRQSTPEPLNGTRTITKCVVNGKISYNDYGCAAGAVATSVVTKPNQNLMAAVRPLSESPAIQREEPSASSSVVAQADTASMARAAECKSIDAQIASLDAMARQPHSGQMQDWIRTERKKLRDLQFRIPCR
jgi:hypothetical protein